MPGNVITINNNDELQWYIGDSKMDKLIAYLNKIGFRENEKDKKK